METIRVQEVFNQGAMNTLVVPEDTPLEEIIERLAGDPCVRGVFLVDSRDRFAGVITRTDLLKWAHLRFGPGGGSSRMHISRRDVYNFVLSAAASDVAHGDWRTLGVRLTDDLSTALHQMLQYDAIDIPVLDNEGKIIGDLRLSQVLAKAIQVSRQDRP